MCAITKKIVLRYKDIKRMCMIVVVVESHFLLYGHLYDELDRDLQVVRHIIFIS